jgi:hypothetical protein
MIGVQSRVRDWHETLSASSAQSVEMRQYVGRTSDAAVILAHAATESHPAVSRRRHHDHVIGMRRRTAAGVEGLPLAVFAVICNTFERQQLCQKHKAEC